MVNASLARRTAESRKPTLSLIEVKDIDHHICTAIDQHEVPADHGVYVIRRRRRQAPHQLLRARPHALSQSGRQGPTHPQLFLQSRWQLVSFGEARRKVTIMVVMPVP